MIITITINHLRHPNVPLTLLPVSLSYHLFNPIFYLLSSILFTPLFSFPFTLLFSFIFSPYTPICLSSASRVAHFTVIDVMQDTIRTQTHPTPTVYQLHSTSLLTFLQIFLFMFHSSFLLQRKSTLQLFPSSHNTY